MNNTIMMLDVAEDVTAQLPAIKRGGYQIVGGYMSSISPNGGKCITPTRARAIAGASLQMLLVHEGCGGVGGRGISAADGKRDGEFCRDRALYLGAGKPPYRVGVYGSGAVCAAVIGHGLADLSWEAQSHGWAGYAAWRARADIAQGPEGRIAGVDADSDQAGADVGAFTPFGAAPAKPPCIYFACDQDFTLAQIAGLVLPYFRAIRTAFGPLVIPPAITVATANPAPAAAPSGWLGGFMKKLRGIGS